MLNVYKWTGEAMPPTIFLMTIIRAVKIGVALYNGINVGRVKVIAFIFSGVLGALAGLVRTANVASGSPTGGNSFILLSICAAVIGGVRITGGKGSIIEVIVGAFVLKLIQDVLVFANISSYWTALVQGVILITAVVIYAIVIKNRKIKMGAGI
ncbi:MAG: ABC transporter permease [Candidatus Humimicrobiaceae bacterium]